MLMASEGKMASTALKIVEDEQPQLSLELPKDQAFEDWLKVGRELATANKVLNWWIGDWWAAGSHRYGERAKVAAHGIFGREFSTLASMASVCRSFETCRRRQHLSFTHHQEVAALSPATADALLDRAEREGWSVRDLRAEAIMVRDARAPRWFETKPAKVFDRDEAKEAIYARLQQAAEIGEICPTADDLAEISGVGSVSTTVALMHVLEEERRIEVKRFQKSRVVRITATGQSTAEPNNQTPHWRVRDQQAPTPAIHSVRQRVPNIAAMIEAEARLIGKALPDFLADLVYIGWHEYQAEKETGQ
jgi:hypothetical protein